MSQRRRASSTSSMSVSSQRPTVLPIADRGTLTILSTMTLRARFQPGSGSRWNVHAEQRRVNDLGRHRANRDARVRVVERIRLNDEGGPRQTWDEYQRTQRMLDANVSRRNAPQVGAAKRGAALLSGLLRCGRCGRMLFVAYGGSRGQVPRCACHGGRVDHLIADVVWTVAELAPYTFDMQS